MIDAILTNTMLPQMSVALLERQMSGGEIERIHVGVGGDGFTYDFSMKDGQKRDPQPEKQPRRAKAQPTGGPEAQPVPAE